MAKKEKTDKTIWICAVEYQYKGDKSYEEFKFDSVEKARKRMRQLIIHDTQDGIIERYISDFGTGVLFHWEIDSRKDSFSINGCGGDYFFAVSVYEEKVK